MPKAKQAVDSLLSQAIAQNPGGSITSLSIENGQAMIKGTAPETIEGIPGSVAQLPV
jgi:hypothetical protein